MTGLPFRQVDVFAGDGPGSGNALAVVLGADELSTETMAGFARWTNLSETTFLLQPADAAADYRVRIFTSTGELPFAGHPTLGSARAWLDHGGSPRRAGLVVQECAAGLIRVRVDGERLAFAAPPLTQSGPLDEPTLAEVLAGLGLPRDAVLDSAWLVSGPRWIGVRLASAEAVLDVVPRFPPDVGFSVGVIGPHPAGGSIDYEVRAFRPGQDPFEDPATGSLNAGLAQWLIPAGHVSPSYVVAQGTAVGRSARLHVAAEGDTIWVGGRAVPVITGSVELPVVDHGDP